MSRHQPVVHADDVAEDALVASCYLEQTLLDVIEVDPRWFYWPARAPMFSAMLRLHRRGDPVDLVTIRAELVRMGDLERAGGDEAVIRLGERIPNVDHAEAYAARVRELHRLRELQAEARRVLTRLDGPVEDVPEFMGEAALRITATCSDPQADGMLAHIADIADQVEADLREREAKGGGTGASTGLKSFDWKLGGGMDPGWLVIVGGRPGQGKSALAQKIVRTVAAERGPALIFSLEMQAHEWVSRMAYAEASIDSMRARTGSLTEGDWASLKMARRTLDKLPIYIDDTPNLTPHQIRARAVRARARHGLALVVVDYMQLMRVETRERSREDEVAEASRFLKGLAKELKVPVVAVAQLNREVERRGGDKRPQMADIRNSGQVEQDADVISFVYREHYYTKKADPRRAEIIIAKMRGGETGTVKVKWEGRYTRFDNDDDDFTDSDTGQRAMGGDLPWR